MKSNIMIFVFIFLFGVINVLNVCAQENQRENIVQPPRSTELELKYEDEELADNLLGIESLKNYDEKTRKSTFNEFQKIIGSLIARAERESALLNALCEKEISLFPDEKKSYIDIATYYYKLKNYEKASQYAKKSIDKKNSYSENKDNINEIWVYTIIGQNYLHEKKFEDAYENFKKAIIAGKKISLPYYLMGNTCYKLKKYVESANAYTVGFTMEPNDAQPVDFFFFAISLHKSGLTKKAEDLLKAGCYRYPNAVGMYMNLGYVYLEQDKLIESYLAFQTEKLLFGPESTFFKPADYNIGMVADLINRRKNSREMKIFNNIVNWDKLSGETKYEQALAEILSAKKEFAANSWIINLFIEQTYMKLKKYNEALSILDEMDRMNPNVSHTYLELGLVYALLNNKEKSAEFYKKAYNLDPVNWKVKEMLLKKNKDKE